MKGCYCGGDKQGVVPVLYIQNNMLYSAIARCDCNNSFKDMGDIKAPRNPALLTMHAWARRDDFYAIDVGSDETYYDAFFRAQNAWWHKNRERIDKRAAKSKPKEIVRPNKENLLEFLQSQKRLVADNETPDFVKEIDVVSGKEKNM